MVHAPLAADRVAVSQTLESVFMIPEEHRSKIADRIQKRLADLHSEMDEIVATARCKFLNEAPQRIGFTFSGSAKTGDLMRECEGAPSAAFVRGYGILRQ